MPNRRRNSFECLLKSLQQILISYADRCNVCDLADKDELDPPFMLSVSVLHQHLIHWLLLLTYISP